MHPVHARYLGRWLLGGTLLFLVAGVLILSGQDLLAGNPRDLTGSQVSTKTPLTPGPAPKVPRPDESSAMSIAAAKQAFVSVPDLDRVVKAAESGDVASLLAMGYAGEFVCGGRASERTAECIESEGTPGVVFEGGGPLPVSVPATWLASRLTPILSQRPVQLESASRDSRLPEGDGGVYYLVFRVPAPVKVEKDSENRYDAFGVVVKPGESRPIQWFTLIGPQGNGLQWVQVLGGISVGQDGARYHILITPASVKDWPGAWGEKGD